MERTNAPGPLIGAAELAALLGEQTLVVLDVRWRLDQPDGRPEYEAGHIPAAIYVDLGAELARHGEPTDGRHPLPSVEQLQESARRWGVNNGDTVVVYDDLGGMSAARAWWLLRHAGVSDVRLLDGAIKAWISAGLELETGDVTATRGDVELAYGSLPLLAIDDAASLPEHGILLDARPAERYRGEAEPVDPRAGHIPGAISAPTSGNLDANGQFLSPTALRERFESVGIDDDTEVGVYCGSGVTAAHDILALTVAGIGASLYPGSWSQWSNLPDRPVATGPEPR